MNPDRTQFEALAQRGNLIPVYRQILADRLTPVLAFEKLASSKQECRYCFLLESVERGDQIGRYSFLGVNPSVLFRSRGRRVIITEADTDTETELPEGTDPLHVLKGLLARYKYVASPDLPPFCGGAVGMCAYDMVRFFERLPDTKPDPLRMDDCCFLLTDTLVVFDHVTRYMKVVCNALVDEEGPAAAYDRAAAKVDDLVGRLQSPAPAAPRQEREPGSIEVEACIPKASYIAAVERCREYILAGDAFQIVLAQRFRTPFTAPPFDVYRALRSVNPSPYMYYLRLDQRTIIGSSPEILVTVDHGKVCVRPIA
ncbi:MAG TPA: chorismate-binding protein, partial [Chthonomonadales bacterium]|nr:chorismate-binding protein [Chthonomonadales bacterium]